MTSILKAKTHIFNYRNLIKLFHPILFETICNTDDIRVLGQWGGRGGEGRGQETDCTEGVIQEGSHSIQAAAGEAAQLSPLPVHPVFLQKDNTSWECT